MINISNLASSFPGQACCPLPNGINVLGLGATYTNKRGGNRMKIWKNRNSLGHKPKNYPVVLAKGDWKVEWLSYLKPCWIKFLRISKIFWIVMSIPEQRHHLPTFGNQVPCHKVQGQSLSLNVNFYDKCWKNHCQIQYKFNWPLRLRRIVYDFNLAFVLQMWKTLLNLTSPSEQGALLFTKYMCVGLHG